METYEAVLLLLAGNLIGIIFKILFDWLKGNRKKDDHAIYVCPLDKSGLAESLRMISQGIDKEEDKLNKIIAIVDFNRKIIEHIDMHYEKIQEVLRQLLGLTEKTTDETKRQTDILQKIYQNGYKK